MAECIRQGIALYLARSSSSDNDLREIAGAFEPASLDDLKDHDRTWAEAARPGLQAPVRRRRTRRRHKSRRRSPESRER